MVQARNASLSGSDHQSSISDLDIHIRMLSTFDGASRNAFHKAAPKDQEDNQQGHQADHGSGHLYVINGTSHRANEGTNDQRKGEILRR